MGKLAKIIISSIIGICVLFIIFRIVFTIGMINTNSRKELDKNFISECKNDLKAREKDFNLSMLEIYYRQGKYYINMEYKSDLSEDDSKIIVKHVKDLLLKDTVKKYLENKYSDSNIRLTIGDSYKKYYYQSPYYLPSESNGANEKNNYKLWYFTKNTEEIINIIEVD